MQITNSFIDPTSSQKGVCEILKCRVEDEWMVKYLNDNWRRSFGSEFVYIPMFPFCSTSPDTHVLAAVLTGYGVSLVNVDPNEIDEVHISIGAPVEYLHNYLSPGENRADSGDCFRVWLGAAYKLK